MRGALPLLLAAQALALSCVTNKFLPADSALPNPFVRETCASEDMSCGRYDFFGTVSMGCFKTVLCKDFATFSDTACCCDTDYCNSNANCLEPVTKQQLTVVKSSNCFIVPGGPVQMSRQCNFGSKGAWNYVGAGHGTPLTAGLISCARVGDYPPPHLSRYLNVSEDALWCPALGGLDSANSFHAADPIRARKWGLCDCTLAALPSSSSSSEGSMTVREARELRQRSKAAAKARALANFDGDDAEARALVEPQAPQTTTAGVANATSKAGESNTVAVMQQTSGADQSKAENKPPTKPPGKKRPLFAGASLANSLQSRARAAAPRQAFPALWLAVAVIALAASGACAYLCCSRGALVVAQHAHAPVVSGHEKRETYASAFLAKVPTFVVASPVPGQRRRKSSTGLSASEVPLLQKALSNSHLQGGVRNPTSTVPPAPPMPPPPQV